MPLTADKLKKNRVFIIAAAVLAAAVLLLSRASQSESTQEKTGFSYSSSEEYREKLQNEVSELIKSATGKKCGVIITFERGYEYLFASNQQLSQNETASDSRREYVFAGSSPVLIEERMPKVCGVAVVCRSISAADEYKIIKLVSALFDLPTNRISVTN